MKPIEQTDGVSLLLQCQGEINGHRGFADAAFTAGDSDYSAYLLDSAKRGRTG